MLPLTASSEGSLASEWQVTRTLVSVDACLPMDSQGTALGFNQIPELPDFTGVYFT